MNLVKLSFKIIFLDGLISYETNISTSFGPIAHLNIWICSLYVDNVTILTFFLRQKESTFVDFLSYFHNNYETRLPWLWFDRIFNELITAFDDFVSRFSFKVIFEGSLMCIYYLELKS